MECHELHRKQDIHYRALRIGRPIFGTFDLGACQHLGHPHKARKVQDVAAFGFLCVWLHGYHFATYFLRMCVHRQFHLLNHRRNSKLFQTLHRADLDLDDPRNHYPRKKINSSSAKRMLSADWANCGAGSLQRWFFGVLNFCNIVFQRRRWLGRNTFHRPREAYLQYIRILVPSYLLVHGMCQSSTHMLDQEEE